MRRLLLFGPIFFCGMACERPRVAEASPLGIAEKPVPPDNASNGPRYAIRGQVTWKGDSPSAPELPAVFGKVAKFGPTINAYFPVIDAETKGLANVVVYVKLGEDFKPAPPKRNLKLRGELNRLYFGESKAPIAVTTVGSEVEMVSASERQTLIRARGASFYTLTFPTAETAHKRPFEKPGIVDFANGNGEYFAACRAYVFDHPWFAISDGKGRFEIADVPLGNRELIAEIADYRLGKYERDPDTQIVMRIFHKEPLKKAEKISVNRAQEFPIEVRDSDFK